MICHKTQPNQQIEYSMRSFLKRSTTDLDSAFVAIPWLKQNSLIYYLHIAGERDGLRPILRILAWNEMQSYLGFELGSTSTFFIKITLMLWDDVMVALWVDFIQLYNKRLKKSYNWSTIQNVYRRKVKKRAKTETIDGKVYDHYKQQWKLRRFDNVTKYGN